MDWKRDKKKTCSSALAPLAKSSPLELRNSFEILCLYYHSFCTPARNTESESDISCTPIAISVILVSQKLISDQLHCTTLPVIVGADPPVCMSPPCRATERQQTGNRRSWGDDAQAEVRIVTLCHLIGVIRYM